ncbi:hypothetical protein, partial [Streptomyces smaragdinus]|uniref:hypothetical protein n=1 Tax=Streptomyces smaragdinus TaxID=2585196 RepID=UPI001E5E6345
MRRRLVLLLVLAVLGLTAAPAPAQTPADPVAEVAAALRDGPVYVHPGVRSQLSRPAQTALAERIRDAGKPVFVAVLPANGDFAESTVFRELRTRVGIAGVYAVQLGDAFGAQADARVMSPRSVDNLLATVRAANPGDAPAQLQDFTGQALRDAAGRAPTSWGGGGAPVGSIVTAVVLLGLIGAGVFLVRSRGKRRRAAQERAELGKLRVVVDEDITAFGEELTRVSFDPSAGVTDEAQRRDYARALDAYETAKSRMDAAHRPADVGPVTRTLAEGRFALATLEARRAGAPLPEDRPPCFFDPRHGVSVRDVEWAPEGGAVRTVPACAADADRVTNGEAPDARTVETASGRQPYWNAGAAYAPWAGGYFGGGMLPGLLMGTMLGSMMYTPGAWAAGDGMTGAEGGDQTGADFDSDDFSGGFGGFGDGGGGDFGGGGRRIDVQLAGDQQHRHGQRPERGPQPGRIVGPLGVEARGG